MKDENTKRKETHGREKTNRKESGMMRKRRRRRARKEGRVEESEGGKWNETDEMEKSQKKEEF